MLPTTTRLKFSLPLPRISDIPASLRSTVKIDYVGNALKNPPKGNGNPSNKGVTLNAYPLTLLVLPRPRRAGTDSKDTAMAVPLQYDAFNMCERRRIEWRLKHPKPPKAERKPKTEASTQPKGKGKGKRKKSKGNAQPQTQSKASTPTLQASTSTPQAPITQASTPQASIPHAFIHQASTPTPPASTSTTHTAHPPEQPSTAMTVILAHQRGTRFISMERVVFDLW